MHHPIGSRIRAMREHRGLSQGQLAYRAGTTAPQISRLENDERPGARASILAEIARVLETTCDYLVGLSDDPGLPEQRIVASPEAQTRALELQRLWRELENIAPQLARQVRDNTITHTEATLAALQAVQERLEEEHKQEQD